MLDQLMATAVAAAFVAERQQQQDAAAAAATEQQQQQQQQQDDAVPIVAEQQQQKLDTAAEQEQQQQPTTAVATTEQPSATDAPVSALESASNSQEKIEIDATAGFDSFYKKAIEKHYMTLRTALRAAIVTDHVREFIELLHTRDKINRPFDESDYTVLADSVLVLAGKGPMRFKGGVEEKHTLLTLIFEALTFKEAAEVMSVVFRTQVESRDCIVDLLRACIRMKDMHEVKWYSFVCRVCANVKSTDLDFGFDADGLKDLYSFTKPPSRLEKLSVLFQQKTGDDDEPASKRVCAETV
jgi:hypothetical protein